MTTDPSQSAPADSSSENTVYRIVVFSPVDDPDALERALMAVPGMDRATARLQSRLMPGIIPYAYALDAAAIGADAVQSLGLHASAVAAHRIPDLLHAHQTHHLRLTPDALEAADTSDRLQTCPCDQIVLISVGVLPSSAPRRFRAASALSSGSSHRTWNEGVRIGGKPRPEAFVVLSDRRPALFMASDEMNYEYLADRLTNSSSHNFRLLITDLIVHCPSARLTPATRDFLQHHSGDYHDFRTHDDFRHYTEFQSLACNVVAGSLPSGPLPVGAGQNHQPSDS